MGSVYHGDCDVDAEKAVGVTDIATFLIGWTLLALVMGMIAGALIHAGKGPDAS